jgi:hypothetical protein
MIQRLSFDWQKPFPIRTDAGEYVLYEEYEKLEKENERLRLLAAKESAKNFKYEAEG